MMFPMFSPALRAYMRWRVPPSILIGFARGGLSAQAGPDAIGWQIGRALRRRDSPGDWGEVGVGAGIPLDDARAVGLGGM